MTDTDTKYRALFRKHYAGLLFYATRFLSEAEAEDIVQDTFMVLWKRRDTIEMGEQIQSFLYKTVYTKCINVINRKKLENQYSASMMEIYQKKIDYYNPELNDTEQRMEGRELRDEIYGVIDELPDKCREIFKLSYLHDMKNKDIAETLNISMRTVEAHMYKALKFLRSKLKYLTLLLIFFK